MDDLIISCPFCSKEFPLSSGVVDHLRKDISEEIEKEIADQIRKENEEKVDELIEQLHKKSEQIDDFKKIEKDLRIKNQELAEKEKDIELVILRRLDEEKVKIEESVIRKITEEHRFKDKEKDKQIDDYKKTLEELNSKLE